MMHEGDFTWRRINVAASQSGIARGVMRRAESPASDERLSRRKQAHDTVNLRGFECLLEVSGGAMVGMRRYRL